MQRGRGAVSARKELEGLDLPFVDPPRAGRRGDEDDGTIEGARAVQLGNDGRRSRLNAGSTRGHAGVDADGFHGVDAAHLRDVAARGTSPEKDTPLPADRFPGDGRCRGCGALRDSRLVDAARGAHVQLLCFAAEETDAAAQDDF